MGAETRTIFSIARGFLTPYNTYSGVHYPRQGNAMPSSFVRWALALTSVSPAMGAAAIIAFSSQKSSSWGMVFTVVGILSAVLSLLVILFVERMVEKETLETADIEFADQKVLEFLLAYLLPVFSGGKLTEMGGSIALTVYSPAIVILVVIYGNIFQFNPVLAVFGYHFYVVTSIKKVKYLVISKKRYHEVERKLTVKKMSEYIYLDVTK